MTTTVPGDNREEPGFDGVSEEELAKRKEEFRTLLFQERQRLMRNAQRTLTEEMTVDQEDLADEMDLASADYNQNLSFRLRGRERHLLVKIEEALERLDDESYWNAKSVRPGLFPPIACPSRHNALHSMRKAGAPRACLRLMRLCSPQRFSFPLNAQGRRLCR